MLTEHQEQMIQEADMLSIKLITLGVFIRGPVFLTLLPEDQSLLQEQDYHMRAYLTVLRKRIARFL
jgi:hypothetical protein